MFTLGLEPVYESIHKSTIDAVEYERDLTAVGRRHDIGDRGCRAEWVGVLLFGAPGLGLMSRCRAGEKEKDDCT